MTGAASTRATFAAEVAGFPLVDPEDGSVLRLDSPHSLAGGAGRWPLVDGIPFLRVGRDSLRRSVLDALDAGDERRALVALLADQDDFARTPPPEAGAIHRAINDADGGVATLRDAMANLAFGPVADYFAYRWSAPTYLSGLALLGEHRLEGAPVVEVACGIGHYLRELALRDVACVGVDVVFAKLWLARRFVVPESVGLVCADVAAGWPLGPARGPAVAFCHDAFYFLPNKPGVVASLRRAVGDGGRVLIGHAHNRRFDHRGVAGEPRSPDEYAAILPDALMYDDAELARSAWSGIPASSRNPAGLADVEAVAMAWSASGRISDPGASAANRLALELPPAGRALRLNPILVDEGGRLRPRWPSSRFEAEYADASEYLYGEPTPIGPVVDRPEVDRLARRRILLDLPGRW